MTYSSPKTKLSVLILITLSLHRRLAQVEHVMVLDIRNQIETVSDGNVIVLANPDRGFEDIQGP